jgi:hypothetical protein
MNPKESSTLQKRKQSPYMKWLRESGQLELFDIMKSSLNGNFEKVAADPRAWLHSASRLKRAAQTLAALGIQSDAEMLHKRPRARKPVFIRLFPVWMMLNGMALESVTKGVLVLQDPKIRTTEPRFFGHDLFWLLETAKVGLDQYEQDLVGRLIDCVIWAGRYPVPKTQDTYYPTATYGADRTIFDRLFNRVKALLTL